MKKIFAFFLTLFSSCAFADSSKLDLSFFNPDQLKNYTDVSVSYLDQVFGTVGTVLQGTSGQMMGHLFYRLNEGFMVVAGLMMVYTLGTTAVRMTTEGVSVSPGKTTLYTTLKVAVGFSLLIPSAATGYSVMQDIVMRVVVAGVGLADEIWSNSLDYLKDGGVVWTKPISGGASGGNQIVTTGNITTLVRDVSSKIFADEVCMVASNHTGKGKNTYDFQTVDNGDGTATYQFPGAPDPLASSNFNCGSVSSDMGKGDKGHAITRAAVLQMIESLKPAAEKYYCSQKTKASGCGGVTMDDSNFVPFILQSSTAYYNALLPLANIEATTAPGAMAFIKHARDQGWMMAGSYYWDMMQVGQDYDDVSKVAGYKPTTWVDPKRTVVAGINLNDAKTAMNTAAGSSEMTSAINNFSRASDAGNSGGSDATNEELQGDITGLGTEIGLHLAIVNPGMGAGLIALSISVSHVLDQFMPSNIGSNPILFLNHVGRACLNVTLSIWISMAVGLSFTALVTAIMGLSICGNGGIQFGQAAMSVQSWMQPILMVICVFFWAIGFELAYYVPLYPYFVFLFSSIGWIISVIEAMVAAPLVCLGLAHPEGHDFLGEAKQAMMLLLNVFLQPALLVIGLVAGMILSFVTLRIFINTFGQLLEDIFNHYVAGGGSAAIMGHAFHYAHNAGSGASGGIGCLIVAPFILALFGMIVYELITLCFTVTYLLRDNVGRWIGAPQSGLPNPMETLNKVKGTAKSYGTKTANTFRPERSYAVANPLGNVGDAVKEKVEQKLASEQKGDDQ